jgi:hypothetical protein
MISDTDREATRVQVELLRRMTVEQRFHLAAGLTNALIEASRQTIAARNPTLDRQGLSVRCVELYYGKELATRFREFLEMRAEEDHVVS